MKVCLQIVKNEKFKKSKSQKFKMWYNRQKKVGKIIVKQCLSIEYNNFDKNCFYQSYYIMSKKYTQISSEGAAVYRQVMKHVVRNPCKISLQKKLKRRRCDRCNLCRPYRTMIVNQSF